jgi:hypothetical protein
MRRRQGESNLSENGDATIIVDFDKDTDVLKRFHVAKQSTMIVFRGKTEVGRSVGDTQRASLEALMRKARNSSG